MIASACTGMAGRHGGRCHRSIRLFASVEKPWFPHLAAQGATEVLRAIARLSAQVSDFSGGPDRTRICDLYRVKVAL
jgi:hypothetical protein